MSLLSVEDRGTVERFYSRVFYDPWTGCHLWLGAPDKDGYGQIASSHNGKRRWKYAHRFAWEIKHGSPPARWSPEGKQLCIDHLCRNRLCVNVEHMELVTFGENTLRGTGFAARHAQSSHCKRGHPFDDENTYRPRRGGRECRACLRDGQRRRRESKGSGLNDSANDDGPMREHRAVRFDSSEE